MPVSSELGVHFQKYSKAPEFTAGPKPHAEIDSQGDAIAIDLREHGRLQSQFDGVLGRMYDSKDMLQRSFNPVTDRWRIEKLRSGEDSVGEQAYSSEIRTNLRTNLSERLQLAENVIEYRIEDDQIYSEYFAGESFSNVLRRGSEYRLQHGSTETDREGLLGERGGWAEIQAKFIDPETPIGTKMTAFSPPGMVKDSAYDRPILDEYELVQGSKGRRMKLTRRIVDFDEGDYYSAALSLDPHYFDDYDGRPLDAWYLSHPVEGVLPELKLKGMSSATFNRIYENSMLQGMIDKYIVDVRAKNVDWRDLAIDINAIYNQIDKEEKSVISKTDQARPIYISKEAIRDTVRLMGLQRPADRGGAGCPTSKGYNINTGGYGTYGGSVAQYAGGALDADNRGPLKFECSAGHSNKRPYGQTIPTCKVCGISVSC